MTSKKILGLALAIAIGLAGSVALGASTEGWYGTAAAPKNTGRVGAYKKKSTDAFYVLETGQDTRTLYADPALVPTAAVNSGWLDTSGCQHVAVHVTNGNTTQLRGTSTIDFGWDPAAFSSTTDASIDAILVGSVASASTALWVIGPGAAVSAPGTTQAGRTEAAINAPVPPKLKVTLGVAASGTGNGVWGVYCR